MKEDVPIPSTVQIVISVQFVEKTIVAPLYFLCSFIKDQWTIFLWVYFWAVHSVPLTYLYIHLPR